MSPLPMTDEEAAMHVEYVKVVRNCVSLLRLSRLASTSQDVRLALHGLEHWLIENDEGWSA